MNDLRSFFPAIITNGALVRPDGVAVSLVGGGAPAWELLAADARARATSDYHRVLCALDAPVDLYVVDAPVQLEERLHTLYERQVMASGVHAAVLHAVADELLHLSAQGVVRAKQVIWAVASHTSTAPASPMLPGKRRRATPTITAAQQQALNTALQRGRRLAAALGQLDGNPAPRLLTAEEIAQLVYRLADPVRAYRYPLQGTLLERVQRVVVSTTVGPDMPDDVAADHHAQLTGEGPQP